MMNKRTMIITQTIMTCMMALSMSGIMYLIMAGPDAFQVSIWLKQFVIAWPIAFVLTNIAFPLASAMTRMLVGAKRA